jgi:hypothetical protein
MWFCLLSLVLYNCIRYCTLQFISFKFQELISCMNIRTWSSCVHIYSNSWSEVCTRCGIMSRKEALVDPWHDQQVTTLADRRMWSCSLDMASTSTDMQPYLINGHAALLDQRTCSPTWSTDMQPYLINGHAAPTWSTDKQPYLINGHAALLDQRTCSPTLSMDMQPYLINGNADQRTWSPTWSTDM